MLVRCCYKLEKEKGHEFPSWIDEVRFLDINTESYVKQLEIMWGKRGCVTTVPVKKQTLAREG